jgi:Bacterial Ig-like domain (group 3)
MTFIAKVDTTTKGTEKSSGTVTFIDGNKDIGTGTVNSGQAILTTSSLSVGQHSIIARYSGYNNFKPSISSTFPITVHDDSLVHRPLFPLAFGLIIAGVCFILPKFKMIVEIESITQHSFYSLACILIGAVVSAVVTVMLQKILK